MSNDDEPKRGATTLDLAQLKKASVDRPITPRPEPSASIPKPRALTRPDDGPRKRRQARPPRKTENADQINIRAPQSVIEQFISMADRQRLTYGALLEKLLNDK